MRHVSDHEKTEGTVPRTIIGGLRPCSLYIVGFWKVTVCSGRSSFASDEVPTQFLRTIVITAYEGPSCSSHTSAVRYGCMYVEYVNMCSALLFSIRSQSMVAASLASAMLVAAVLATEAVGVLAAGSAPWLSVVAVPNKGRSHGTTAHGRGSR